MTRSRRAELEELEQSKPSMESTPEKESSTDTVSKEGSKVRSPEKSGKDRSNAGFEEGHALATFLYLHGVALCYTIAFISFAVQVAPIFSCRGLSEPVHPLFQPLFEALSGTYDASAIILFTVASVGAVFAALLFFNNLNDRLVTLSGLTIAYGFLMFASNGWFTLPLDYLLLASGVFGILLLVGVDHPGACDLVRFGILSMLSISVFVEGAVKFSSCPGWTFGRELLVHPFPIPTGWHLNHVGSFWLLCIDLFVALAYVAGPLYALMGNKVNRVTGLIIIGFVYFCKGVSVNNGWSVLLAWTCISACLDDNDLSTFFWSEFLLNAWGAPKIKKKVEEEQSNEVKQGKKVRTETVLNYAFLASPLVAMAGSLTVAKAGDEKGMLGLSLGSLQGIYCFLFVVMVWPGCVTFCCFFWMKSYFI